MLHHQRYRTRVMRGVAVTDIGEDIDMETHMRRASVTCLRKRPVAAVTTIEDLLKDKELVTLNLVVGVRHPFDSTIIFDERARKCVCFTEPCTGTYRLPGGTVFGKYAVYDSPLVPLVLPAQPPMVAMQHLRTDSVTLAVSSGRHLFVDDEKICPVMSGTHTYTIPVPKPGVSMLSVDDEGVCLRFGLHPPEIRPHSMYTIPQGGTSSAAISIIWRSPPNGDDCELYLASTVATMRAKFSVSNYSNLIAYRYLDGDKDCSLCPCLPACDVRDDTLTACLWSATVSMWVCATRDLEIRCTHNHLKWVDECLVYNGSSMEARESGWYHLLWRNGCLLVDGHVSHKSLPCTCTECTLSGRMRALCQYRHLQVDDIPILQSSPDVVLQHTVVPVVLRAKWPTLLVEDEGELRCCGTVARCRLRIDGGESRRVVRIR